MTQTIDPTVKKAGGSEVKSHDQTMIELTVFIIKELRQMNEHLSLTTGLPNKAEKIKVEGE